MCTDSGASPILRLGCTWCGSPGELTGIGAVHVEPPSSERRNIMFEFPFGSPKNGLVELFHARYTTPLRAAIAGWATSRVALTNRRSPVSEPPTSVPAWSVKRRLTANLLGETRVAPHSVSSPGWTMGSKVGSGAPGALKVANRNVAPPSSEINIWMKSVSELLKHAKGT